MIAETRMNDFSSDRISLRIVSTVVILLMIWAGVDLMDLASGTGDFVYSYSEKAVIGLAIYWLTVLIAVPLSIWAILRPDQFNVAILVPLENRLVSLGVSRWVIALLILTLPSILLLGRTGVSLTFVSIRLLMFAVVSIIGGILIPAERANFLERVGIALLITASIFTVARRLIWVRDYPFKLSWSEGNRIWDYSLYFWRSKYRFADDFYFPAYLTPGRHGLWGLPFLIPGVTIRAVRFWDVLVWTVPYILLGWAFFSREKFQISTMGKLAGVLWTFLFLSQGGVLPPLVLAALIVVITFDPGRVGKILTGTALASLYAGLSRWTWSLAPAAWTGIWALLRTDPKDRLWNRLRLPFFLGLIGAVAAVAAQIFLRWAYPNPASGVPQSLSQPLLWYRLFPSATNPIGIIPGLIIAIAPIVFFVLWARIKGWINWDWLQILVVLAVLIGFLIAGLVASAKIGGGDNLHNLDMFLVTLLFVLMEVIYQLARQGWKQLETTRTSLCILAAIALLIVSWASVRSGEPLKLPANGYVEDSIQTIQEMVLEAKNEGEVLFIDQRQLITFDSLQNVVLHPEYELKDMMNHALSSDQAYFDQFERDLAAGRFSLIVVEPQDYEYEGISTEFGDENDLWVRYITFPLLKYYRPIFTDGDLRIALYVPKE